MPSDDTTSRKKPQQHVSWLIHILSKRELQILYCISHGISTRDIADHYYISEKTVKFHLTNIYHKLGVRNRVGLIVLLYERGWAQQLDHIVPGGSCIKGASG